MKRYRLPLIVLLVIGLGVWWWWWWRCGPETTLLLVRHADRQGNDDALNAAGTARAQELVHVGEKAGLAAIYRSNTIRARDTAALLASAVGLTMVEYVASETGPLVDTIFANNRGQTVLVVGHSNTVPEIIQAAGGPALADIAELEFDNLFVVTVCRCRRGPARVFNLQYGAVSP
jgi:2,3-bisphosphoglycerate-dependent phosphoglycerate mutase